nr:reverse transcriptase domain-containing protein [Tanacetum cinerariifolium]
MDHQYPTVAKIPVLDTGKFEQWQFRIQQYLQHEHYAIWEVIEFSDSYKVPTNTDPDNTTTRKDDEQSGRTVTITTEDMQRKKNDVKARTTLLLSLPNEHHFFFFSLIAVQTSSSSISILLIVAFIFRQWEVPSGSGNFLTNRTLPNNTVTNPKEDLKGITTRSGIAYKGPMIPTTSYPPKVVERETEVTKDTVPHTNNGSTKDVQPLVVQVETQTPTSEPVVAPIKALVSAPKPNPKPSIPYPSRLHGQKLCDKANDQMEKFFQIFQYLNFNISFADALILMSKFASTIKSLLNNKEKLIELARTSLNEHCSAVLLKKLPEKLGDLGELTIRVGNKAITFNLDQTSRYSANYDAESINRIDVIDVACDEYSQEIIGYS